MNADRPTFLRLVRDGAEAPPLQLEQAVRIEEEDDVDAEVMVRPEPGGVDTIEPTRVWSPSRPRVVDVVVRQVETLRSERGGLLRAAARASGAGAKYGALGVGRATGGWWRWVTAAEHDQVLASRPDFVEAQRERRRKISLWTAGVFGGGDLVLWVGFDWPVWVLPAGLLGVVAAVGGAAEALSRRGQRPEGEDGASRHIGTHPGSKAVRAALAAAGQLGKAEEIRVVGPVVRDREAGAWMATADLKPGVPAGKAVKRVPEIAAAMGVDPVQLAVDPVRGHGGRISIWCADEDPLSGDPVPSPLVGRMEAFDVWREKVTVGRDARGRAVGFGLPERSLLVGGEPGAGKSVASNNVLCSVAMDPRVPMWLVDGKGGADLLDYEPVAARFLGDPDPEAALEMFTDLRDEMSDRYRKLRAVGARKLTGELAEELGIQLLFVHVDELQVFTTVEDDKLRKAIITALWDIVSRGRAGGIDLSAATQRPGADVVPTRLRDILSIRWALRCTTPEASDTVLGRGWAAQGYNAARLDSTQRGAGLLLAEGAHPLWLRSAYLSDNDVAVITRRAYRLREAAGTLPVRESHPGVLLLKACIAVCGGAEKIRSADLLERLAAMPQWEDLEGDPAALAARLRPYGVAPGQVWISDGKGSGANRQGYTRSAFVEALEALQRR